MSDQDDPFNKNNNEPVDDPFKDQLSAITNSDGSPKYENTEEAIKALVHSQDHIKTLETERKAQEDKLKQLEEELSKRDTVDDFVSRLSREQQNQEPPANQETTEETGLTEEAVINLFNKYQSEQQTKVQRESNYKQVVSKLVEAYGDKASEAVAKKAEELGMPVKKLEELAHENPTVVLNLFGSMKTTDSPTITSSFNLSPTPKDDIELQPPEKSMLQGATMQEQAEYMRKVKEKVYKDLNIET